MATEKRLQTGIIYLDTYDTEADLPVGPNDRNGVVIVRNYGGNGPTLAFNNNGSWVSTSGGGSGAVMNPMTSDLDVGGFDFISSSDGDVTVSPDGTGETVVNSILDIVGPGTGVIGAYDLKVGDTDGTPTYGMVQIGNSTFGRTSFNAASLDLDGSLLLWNNAAPATSNIEFAFAESSNSIRFAIPASGVGAATYNPRSMLVAGPAPANDEMVTVTYWQGQGIFDNLACDTSGDGADLGVQNDLEVEGDIFVDNIVESTTNTGVTIEGVVAQDSELVYELAENEQTGTTYTLVLSDRNRVVSMNNASANTLTVPPNSSVSYPIGTQIHVHQLGAGQTTLDEGAGVTINSAGASLDIQHQYGVTTLWKRDTNTWLAFGDL